MRRTVKWTLFVLFIALLLGTGGGLLYRSTQSFKGNETDESRTVPVTVMRLASKAFSTRGEYAARLAAVNDVIVAAKVGGTIVEDLISEGDNVHGGQPLYRIEDDAYRIAMEQAEAALDLARENLRKAQNISRPELIRRLEAVVDERETALHKAASDAGRFEELYREGAVPLSQKESADLTLASARSRMKIARENLEEARTGTRIEDRAAAEAAVRQADAAWRLSRDTWEKAVVRSPLAGTVAGKKVFTGDTVQPGTPVAEIVDLTSFKIDIGVSGDDVAYFKTGGTVTVVPLRGSEPLTAFVKDVGVKADEKTGSFPVILEMDNPDGDRSERRFRAGMDVSAVFTRIELPNALVVPSSALLREVERAWVFVVEEDAARKIEVTVKAEAEGEAVIASGLSEGDVLVVVGQQRLRDGDSVELTFE